MRRLTGLVLGLGLFGLLAPSAFPQDNPRGTSKTAVKGNAVWVEYGRPALNGRTVDQMLDKLKPGGVWRLGADKSTTFSTATDLVFGEVTLPKGEYSLWARREADNSWQLVFNKQHGQWGTKHDQAQDFAGVPLTESKAQDAAEQVTLSLAKQGDGGLLTIRWGDMQLATEFKAK